MQDSNINYDFLSGALIVGGLILLVLIIVIKRMANNTNQIKSDQDIDKKIKDSQKNNNCTKNNDFDSKGHFS